MPIILTDFHHNLATETVTTPTEPQAGHLSKPSGSPPPTRRLPPEPVALESRRLAPTFLSRLNYIPKKAFPGR